MIPKFKCCTDCLIVKPGIDFCQRNVNGVLYCMAYCRKCQNKRKSLWFKANPEVKKNQDAAYYKVNAEKIKQRSKNWAASNPDKVRSMKSKTKTGRQAEYQKNKYKYREMTKAWSKKHPEYRAARDAIRRKNTNLAKPKWANSFFINEIYSLAQLRTKITGDQWDVDHIIPLQSKIVCGLHVPENLRVILHTDNMAKGNKFNPDDLLWTFRPFQPKLGSENAEDDPGGVRSAAGEA